MSLTKGDFYFGALLSQLIKNHIAPALIEGGEKARIYSFDSDYGNYEIYAKYASKPHYDNTEVKRWHYSFTYDELSEIQTVKNNVQYLFAFICGEKDLKDSEVLILTEMDLQKCVGKNYKTPDRRVSVRLDKGRWSFTVYGTGLDEKEDSIEITRNTGKRIKEIGGGFD